MSFSIARTRLARLALGGCLVFFSACEAGSPIEPIGGPPSGPQTPPPAPAPTANGVLLLMVEGLDTGVPADIQVTGPSGFSRSVSSPAQLTGLAAGRYSVISREVNAAGETFTPAAPTQDVDVGSDGPPATVRVSYSVPGGALVTVTGLPGGTPASISVTPPAGPTISVAATRMISGGRAGRWRLAASPVSSGGNTYRPTPGSYDVQASARDTVRMPVNYALTTGSIAVAVTGLPSGASGSVTVTGPGGYNQSVTGTVTLTDLEPGNYVVTAQPVAVGDFDFTPNPSRRTVTVVASLVAAAAPIAYEGQAGRIAISASGLPAGLSPTFTITGNSGSSTLNGAGTSEFLSPGTYTVTATTLTSGSTTYTPSPASANVVVNAGATTSHSVTYSASGPAASLTISITGLQGSADVLVTGPEGYERHVTSSTTLQSLEPGRYTVVARPVETGAGRYAVGQAQRDVDVLAGSAGTLTLVYAVLPAVVEVPVLGLPVAGTANITVTAPSGATSVLHASSIFSPATPGRWRLSASPVVIAGSTYAPAPASYDRTVIAGDTLSMPVTYSLVTGAIAISVGGLPAGASGNVSVTGPNGYSQSVTGTTTLVNLQPGTYTVTAAAITISGVTYLASPATRTVSVTATAVASAAPIVYTGQAGSLTITTTGLSVSVTPTFTLTGPGGTRALSSAGTVEGLLAGSYTLTAATIVNSGTTYTPSPASRSISITVGGTTSAAFSYTATGTAGSLAITVSGLGAGVAADLLVTGPNSYSHAVTATETLASLTPGTYTITARNVRSAQGTFGVTPTSRDVDVPAGGSASSSIAYVALPAYVTIPVWGLPGAASITVTPPTGAPFSVTASTNVTPAAAGRWRLAATNVQSGGSTYAPLVSSYDQTALAGDTLSFPVQYALSTGSIAVAISGLPGSTAGSVTVTGPAGFSQAVTATTTLTNLAPGAYTVTASNVVTGGVTYTPSPASRAVTVTASLVASAAPVSYASQTGSLAITVSGLGAGVAADLLVTGPNSFSQTVTATGTLASLTPGTYTITARNVRAAQGTYGVAPSSRTVDVPAGGSASSSISYAALPALVDVPVSGLPGGASASITVTPPVAAAFAVSVSTQVNPAATGRWRLAASNVFNGGNTYVPSPASYDQTVLAGDTLRFPVVYSLSTGSIAVSVGGLPGASNGSVSVTGPGAFSQVLTATTTLTNLTPGAYTVAASPVVVSGVTYVPSPATRAITVTASLVAFAAPVTYTSQAGSLAITVSGLAAGVAGDLLVTGPNSYSLAVTATTTLNGLVPGAYNIAVRNVRAAQGTFGATPASRDVTVPAGGSASNTVSYAALPSVVNVPVSGVPGGASAAITMTAPSSATSSVTASSVISPAASGRWRLNASNVSSGGNTYAPTPASYDQTVLAGDTLNFPVSYAIATGSIAVSVAGLPAGTNGNVTVTGPASYSQGVTGTTTLTNLTPGAYTVTAAAVVSGGVTYTPTPATRAVTVAASLVASPAPVTYAAAAPTTGSLTISASGLPGGVTPTFTLTGSGSQAISGAGTTSGLATGAYTLAAATITSGATTYTPSPASAAVTITAGATTTATFSYAASGGGSVTNLSIENMYVTQAVQNWAGTAQIVTNRDALVRVFVKAAAANTLQPDVRVRVYDGTTLLQTYTIAAGASSVPTTVSEGTLSSSWNVVIPAGNVRANMRVLADVDPGNALGESDRTDNVWPAGGSAATIATAAAPAFTVRFVPVVLGGVTGNVSTANKEQFLVTAKRIWPVNSVSSSVRAPFTSNAADLQSSNGNNAWNVVLSEINLLQMTDGMPSTTSYYGVVKVAYSSGVAGIGYVPGRAAIGWDNLPSADQVFAHEIGHNFGFPHAPCGVSGGSSYPYAGGVTGAWGWNSATNTLVAPTAHDIMGYCSNPWISDWTWNNAITSRASSGMELASATTGEGLLIWGRITDGRMVLEPAFRVHAAPTARAVKSTHRVVISDATGGTLFDVPIAAERVDHDTRDERQFAVVVPWSDALERMAARITVRDPRTPFPSAVSVSSTASAVVGDPAVSPTLPDPDESVQSVGAGRSSVTWNTARYPMVLVRDAMSGEIVSILRKSGDGYLDQGRAAELVFSDGVRSTLRVASPKR